MSERDELDQIYDVLDDLLIDGYPQIVDTFLAGAPVKDFELTILLGILTITAPARPLLPARARIYMATAAKFFAKYPLRAKAAMQGLE